MSRTRPIKELLYRGLVEYYDYVYSWKDYKAEAATLVRTSLRLRHSQGRDLLEVGCGTGEYLRYLTEQFTCTGLDISSHALRVARRKLPTKVSLVQGDMTRMRLNRKFDVILCVFGVICHARTYQSLRRTIKGFYDHLKCGGVAIIEPWYIMVKKMSGRELVTSPRHIAGAPVLTTYESPDLKIARMRTPQVLGYREIVDTHTMIAERDKSVVHAVCRRELSLFDASRFLSIMEGIGFTARFDKSILSGAFVGLRT